MCERLTSRVNEEGPEEDGLGRLPRLGRQGCVRAEEAPKRGDCCRPRAACSVAGPLAPPGAESWGGRLARPGEYPGHLTHLRRERGHRVEPVGGAISEANTRAGRTSEKGPARA